MLSLLDPSASTQLPALRLLILGGEACPRELMRTWAGMIMSLKRGGQTYRNCHLRFFDFVFRKNLLLGYFWINYLIVDI